jgi:hypothetical protein
VWCTQNICTHCLQLYLIFEGRHGVGVHPRVLSAVTPLPVVEHNGAAKALAEGLLTAQLRQLLLLAAPPEQVTCAAQHRLPALAVLPAIQISRRHAHMITLIAGLSVWHISALHCCKYATVSTDVRPAYHVHLWCTSVASPAPGHRACSGLYVP